MKGLSMTPRTSSTLNRLSESATLAMARMARELRTEGHDVIALSLGEPDFDTPQFIKDAAKRAIDDNHTHYTPVAGYPDVLDAISHKFKRDNGLNYKPSQIVVSTGAKQTIANAVMALVSPGEEVLLPAPYWVSYSEIVKMAGGTPIVITTDIKSDFKMSPQQLKAHIGPKTRMMIFSSPCNPTGSVYSRDELARLAEVIVENPNFVVICDEIYELICFEGTHESLASFAEVYDQVITVNGVSKGFAMTGWRLGYMGAAEWIAKACTKMQGQTTSAPSSISQKATKAAVAADPNTVHYMKEAFFKRRSLMLGLLGEISGLKLNIPQGAFYIFPECSSYFGKSWKNGVIANASDLCMYLLQQAHVAVVTGDAFGAPNYFRISYAASEDKLKIAAQRMKESLDALT
jgi:aspartate aminotransferase